MKAPTPDTTTVESPYPDLAAVIANTAEAVERVISAAAILNAQFKLAEAAHGPNKTYPAAALNGADHLERAAAAATQAVARAHALARCYTEAAQNLLNICESERGSYAELTHHHEPERQ